MYMHFSVIHLEPGDSDHQYETGTHWIILDGACEAMSDHQFFHLSAHDLLYAPPDFPFHIFTKEGLSIGLIMVYDIRARNMGLELLHCNSLIRNTFYYALDLQGIDDKKYSACKNTASQLMQEVIAAEHTVSLEMHPEVSRVLTEISNHYTDCDFDIHALIASTGYSSSHFRKLFRKDVGIAPLQYLMSRRIEYAKKLMWQQKKNISIKEIAYNSGFPDAYYFSRQFKAYVKQTPSEYIRLIEAASEEPPVQG